MEINKSKTVISLLQSRFRCNDCKNKSCKFHVNGKGTDYASSFYCEGDYYEDGANDILTYLSQYTTEDIRGDIDRLVTRK